MKQICELNDKVILGRDGMSTKAPRITARAIVKNQNGLYAVMYADKFKLHSLPGGGVEVGEDVLTALRREIYEETGCVCDEIKELGIVAENRASLDYTQINYYFVVTTTPTPGENHLTEAEQDSRTVVEWHTFDEMVRLINEQEFDRVQGKYLKARDVAALYEYSNQRFENLSNHFGVSISLKTIYDADCDRYNVTEEGSNYTITLNVAKIPATDYAIHAGYHVSQILLPRLKLETERLILRRYYPDDAVQCFAFLSNEQDAYMDCCKAFSVMDEEYHERVMLFGQRETQYMVTLKESGEIIGTVNVFADDSRAVDAMEIGYSIAHAHQRKGYAFEALSALLDLLQSDLCLEMVTAGALPENVASENLLMKLGFHKEGLRHKAVWHEGLNRPVDLIYYYRDRPALAQSDGK